MSKEPANRIRPNLLTKLRNLLTSKHRLQQKPTLLRHDGSDESNRTKLVAWAKLISLWRVKEGYHILFAEGS